MKQIPVSQTVYARVDDDAHRVVSIFNWYLVKGYARRGVHPNVTMHRFIWESLVGDIPKGRVIDHINGDRLDNRLENLRLATVRENNRNARPRNKYKGVSRAPDGTWSAKIYTGNRKEKSTCPFIYPDGRAGEWRNDKDEPEYQWLFVNGERTCQSRQRYYRESLTVTGLLTEEKAGKVYDNFAKAFFGEFARLNFPRE